MNDCTLTFTADGKKFVTSEGAFRGPFITTIWETQNFTVLKQFSHEESTYGAFSSPDGNSIFIPGADDHLDIIRLDTPLYRLIYEFDVVEVSNVLLFLWELALDGINFKHVPRPKSLKSENDHYIVWTDKTRKYQSLIERPRDHKGKLDQVIAWLEARCAYKKPELYGCQP